MDSRDDSVGFSTSQPITPERKNEGRPHDEEVGLEEISLAERKSLTRKLDAQLIPIIMLLYLFSFLDRGMFPFRWHGKPTIMQNVGEWGSCS
jgi:hypothetical protein